MSSLSGVLAIIVLLSQEIFDKCYDKIPLSVDRNTKQLIPKKKIWYMILDAWILEKKWWITFARSLAFSQGLPLSNWNEIWWVTDWIRNFRPLLSPIHMCSLITSIKLETYCDKIFFVSFFFLKTFLEFIPSSDIWFFSSLKQLRSSI